VNNFGITTTTVGTTKVVIETITILTLTTTTLAAEVLATEVALVAAIKAELALQKQLTIAINNIRKNTFLNMNTGKVCIISTSNDGQN